MQGESKTPIFQWGLYLFPTDPVMLRLEMPGHLLWPAARTQPLRGFLPALVLTSLGSGEQNRNRVFLGSLARLGLGELRAQRSDPVG